MKVHKQEEWGEIELGSPHIPQDTAWRLSSKYQCFALCWNVNGGKAGLEELRECTNFSPGQTTLSLSTSWLPRQRRETGMKVDRVRKEEKGQWVRIQPQFYIPFIPDQWKPSGNAHDHQRRSQAVFLPNWLSSLTQSKSFLKSCLDLQKSECRLFHASDVFWTEPTRWT